MERQIITKTLHVEGMTCPSCEMRIENKLKKLPGISEVQAKYANEIVQLTYDSKQVDLLSIIEVIESLDYTVKSTRQRENNSGPHKRSNISGILGVGIIIFAVYFVLRNVFGVNILDIFNFIPEVNQSMGYGILFIVGLLTSLHCIAMCGGINLSQCVAYNANKDSNASKLKPSILYNAGRVISYTLIGGIVGAIGSVVSLSGSAKGLVSIAAGVFMLIMGLNMLNIFPWLRNLTPRMPKFFGNKIHNNSGKYGPLYVGLLNGLMPCGPLQSMQLYALGTGSFLSGALSMFMFSLGTVPLMFGFGAVSSMLSSKFTHKMMKVSAALVMLLGIVMLNRGFSLSGIDPLAFITSPSVFGSSNGSAGSAGYQNAASISDGVQYITTQMTGGRYSVITVQKGIPVKWTIQAEQKDLNGCNNPIRISKYGLEIKLKPGDNLVEFTPDESGTIPYSCWMGMIRSRIIVVDDLADTTAAVADSSYDDDYDTGGGGCCGGGSSGGATSGGIADNYSGFPVDNGISTDNIMIATAVDDVQEVTVTINSDNFSPGVIILQEGVDFVIKFDVKDQFDKSDPYDSFVYFPEYQGGVDLSDALETPYLPAVGDFSFQDAYGTKRVFVKVVSDISNIDEASIKQDAKNYEVPSSSGGSSGGASCH